MPAEALDKLLRDCSAELAAIGSVLELLRSGQLRITHMAEDIKRFQARAANLRKTIRQLNAHKRATTAATSGP